MLAASTNYQHLLRQFRSVRRILDQCRSPSNRIVALDISVTDASPKSNLWEIVSILLVTGELRMHYPYASDVSSNSNNAQAPMEVFDAGFSETTLVMSLSGSQLKVESYDRFKDNCGRSNYASSYYFQKSKVPGGTNQVEFSLQGGPNQAALDLDIWNCDEGGEYYIRQLGNRIWWFGEKDPNAPDWSNVMRGTLNGNTITADWADVPKGSVMQSGSLAFRVVSSNEINAIQKID
jgi:hypothetical protein